MRHACFLLMLALALGATGGCRQPLAGRPTAPSAPRPLIAPDNSLAGRVVRVNQASRFVVVRFPPGRTPKLDQKLGLYRGGLKVGEARVSNWRSGEHVVADLLAGEAVVGDEVATW